jgi:hypothetical protein
MSSEKTSSKYKWDGEWIESVIEEMLQRRYQTWRSICIDKVDLFEYLKGKQMTTFQGREAYFYGEVGEYNVFISVPVQGLCSNPDREIFAIDFVFQKKTVRDSARLLASKNMTRNILVCFRWQLSRSSGWFWSG